MALLKTRTDVESLVENRYFGSVVANDIDAVVACFTPGARVLIRHGDNEPRHFVNGQGEGPQSADLPLHSFYEHLCGNYVSWFGDFAHFVDLEQQRSAATFTVKLDPRPSSAYLAEGLQTLMNCNFFQYKDGFIDSMTIYYSNPDAGEKVRSSAAPDAHAPAGYPPEE